MALVAVEVRFPAAGTGPPRPPAHRAIRDLLGEGWVLESGQQQTFEVAFGPGGVQGQNIAVENLTRITIRDRTRVVTARAESLTIEATSYEGYGEFRRFLAAAFEAVQNVLRPDGVTRLGMRYIDEIRVSKLEGPDPWDTWLDPSLLAPRAEGLQTRGWTSAVEYDTGKDRRMVLRYGPADVPGSATGANRRAVARFLAFVDVLQCDHLVDDVRRGWRCPSAEPTSPAWMSIALARNGFCFTMLSVICRLRTSSIGSVRAGGANRPTGSTSRPRMMVSRSSGCARMSRELDPGLLGGPRPPVPRSCR